MDQTDNPRNKGKRQPDPAIATTAHEYPVMGASVERVETDRDWRDRRDRDGKRNARRGSSRTTRHLEDVERRVSKAARRVAKAVSRGMSTYIDRRDKAASRRKDGALVDFSENAARGLSRALSESSPAIVDLSQAFNRRRHRRRIRRALARLPRIPFFG